MSKPLPQLSRSWPDAPPAAPVRIVHLGIGNFHRSHQAWYTAHAADGDQWGIAAFTGRRPDMAELLTPQDGLYTLIVRSADGDELELVGSLSAVHAASEHEQYLNYLERPEVAIVTLTVTEVGYRRGPDGHLAADDTVEADRRSLIADPRGSVRSVPGKLVAGLLARRAAGAGPLTILSCDNLPHNGRVAQGVVADLIADVDPSLSAWVEENVDFASSMVDRITPSSNADDQELVAERMGYRDASPVATEPFTDWVIGGTFPAGRPQWETAGAQIVADVGPFEQRKLWLLNGSHSLLAYAGSIRGHQTIDQAVADEDCRRWVDAFWDEAERHLALTGPDTARYRSALLDRFANPRIRHLLAQIAADGSTKVAVRTIPAMRAERAAGRIPIGCATTVAAWVLHLRGLGAPVNDVDADRFAAAASADDLTAAVVDVVRLFDADLAEDQVLIETIVEQAAAITAEPPATIR